MLVAKGGAGFRCVARHTDKTQSPFYCPVCNEEVLLKKGAIRVHHYSHKVKSDCQHGEGESQQHLKAKEGLYDALSQHPDCRKCELERVLDGVRPDVSLYIRDQRVAIEVQKSKIEIRDIKRRFNRYRKLKINLIWVIPSEAFKPYKTTKGKELIKGIPLWQKFLHACYFGRVYYWEEGAIVRPVHFGSYRTWVESGNWVDDSCTSMGEDLSHTNWYQENHGSADYGGRWKYSKSIFVPKYPDEEKRLLHLVDHFGVKQGKPYSGKNWTTPQRVMWADNLVKWW